MVHYSILGVFAISSNWVCFSSNVFSLSLYIVFAGIWLEFVFWTAVVWEVNEWTCAEVFLWICSSVWSGWSSWALRKQNLLPRRPKAVTSFQFLSNINIITQDAVLKGFYLMWVNKPTIVTLRLSISYTLSKTCHAHKSPPNQIKAIFYANYSETIRCLLWSFCGSFDWDIFEMNCVLMSLWLFLSMWLYCTCMFTLINIQCDEWCEDLVCMSCFRGAVTDASSDRFLPAECFHLCVSGRRASLKDTRSLYDKHLVPTAARGRPATESHHKASAASEHFNHRFFI